MRSQFPHPYDKIPALRRHLPPNLRPDKPDESAIRQETYRAIRMLGGHSSALVVPGGLDALVSLAKERGFRIARDERSAPLPGRFSPHDRRLALLAGEHARGVLRLRPCDEGFEEALAAVVIAVAVAEKVKDALVRYAGWSGSMESRVLSAVENMALHVISRYDGADDRQGGSENPERTDKDGFRFDGRRILAAMSHSTLRLGY